jgi:hypothetical protein
LVKGLAIAIAVLSLLAGPLTASASRASAVTVVPTCSSSQFTIAMGVTHRYPLARPMRGGLTSMTWVYLTNNRATCRLEAGTPSVSFDFTPHFMSLASGLFSPSVSASPGGYRETVKSGLRVALIIFVRAYSISDVRTCEPKTAYGIALNFLTKNQGEMQALFPRTIAGVCSNSKYAVSSFGAGWANRWIL